MLILCQEPKEAFVDFPPALVVEVLSPSTKDKDLITKYQLCQDFGIRYYLVVDPDEESITVHELMGKNYRELKESSTFHLTPDCELLVDFDGVF